MKPLAWLILLAVNSVSCVRSTKCYLCSSDNIHCREPLDAKNPPVDTCEGGYCLKTLSWRGEFNPSPGTQVNVTRNCSLTSVGLLYSVYNGVYSSSSECQSDFCTEPSFTDASSQVNLVCYSCKDDECLRNATELNTCVGASCYEVIMTDRTSDMTVYKRGCLTKYFGNNLAESETGDARTAVCNKNQCNYGSIPERKLLKCRRCVGEECELTLAEQNTCEGFSCVTINVTLDERIRYEKDCITDYWGNFCGLEVDSYPACSCRTDMCNDKLQNTENSGKHMCYYCEGDGDDSCAHPLANMSRCVGTSCYKKTVNGTTTTRTCQPTYDGYSYKKSVENGTEVSTLNCSSFLCNGDDVTPTPSGSGKEISVTILCFMRIQYLFVGLFCVGFLNDILHSAPFFCR